MHPWLDARFGTGARRAKCATRRAAERSRVPILIPGQDTFATRAGYGHIVTHTPNRTPSRAARVLATAGCCLLAGLTTTVRSQACALPGDAVTVQAGKVALGSRVFTVATQRLADLDDARSRLVVLDARCRVAWSAIADGALSHFDTRRLGGTRLLQFVTLQVAGDGTGYVHHLLLLRGGRLALLLPPVRHTGKDGFYLGPLHHGGKDGVVTWTADTAAESEAAPHPFIVRTWVWSGSKLTGPAHYETSRTYAAPPDAGADRPNFVARAIGLPFRDQTGDISSRFSDFDHVESRVQDREMQQAEGR